MLPASIVTTSASLVIDGTLLLHYNNPTMSDPRGPCQRSTLASIASANEGVRRVILEPAKKMLIRSELTYAQSRTLR